MREYVFSIVSFSLAIGLILMLAPDGAKEGIKKHVKLIGALCLVCILIDPISNFIDAIDSFDAGNISEIIGSGEELYDKYSEIYENYLDGGYGENIGEAVKDSLLTRFGIEKSSCRILTELDDADGDGIKEPKKITVILSGSAKYKEPESIKRFVSELFECEAAVAVE